MSANNGDKARFNRARRRRANKRAALRQLKTVAANAALESKKPSAN